MMEIDALIDKLKALYKVEGHIGFDHPAYEEFHNDIQQFIIQNYQRIEIPYSFNVHFIDKMIAFLHCSVASCVATRRCNT